MLRTSLSGEDAYGRMSIPGVSRAYSSRALRRLRSAETNFVHRAKNGVYDPLTYYHIFDLLMKVDPGQDFRTADMLALLRDQKPQLVWDPTVVGRVLTDLAESLHESYGRPIIGYTRRWNGMTYDTSAHPANRIAMTRLQEDLYKLCERTIAEELEGTRAKRLNSPLNYCPSLIPEEAVAV